MNACILCGDQRVGADDSIDFWIYSQLSFKNQFRIHALLGFENIVLAHRIVRDRGDQRIGANPLLVTANSRDWATNPASVISEKRGEKSGTTNRIGDQANGDEITNTVDDRLRVAKDEFSPAAWIGPIGNVSAGRIDRLLCELDRKSTRLNSSH